MRAKLKLAADWPGATLFSASVSSNCGCPGNLEE